MGGARLRALSAVPPSTPPPAFSRIPVSLVPSGIGPRPCGGVGGRSPCPCGTQRGVTAVGSELPPESEVPPAAAGEVVLEATLPGRAPFPGARPAFPGGPRPQPRSRSARADAPSLRQRVLRGDGGSGASRGARTRGDGGTPPGRDVRPLPPLARAGRGAGPNATSRGRQLARTTNQRSRHIGRAGQAKTNRCVRVIQGPPARLAAGGEAATAGVAAEAAAGAGRVGAAPQGQAGLAAAGAWR